MISSAIEWVIDRRLRKMSSSLQGDVNDRAVVLDILKFWKLGASLGLRAYEGSDLAAAEMKVPWNRRLFFWEGNAFGVCGRFAVTRGRANPRADYHAPGYRFMFWTGLGFWNGVASPLPRISLDPERWKDVPEFQEEYSLVLGGSGFSHTAAAGVIQPARLVRAGVRCAADIDGIYRGVGRALWFLHMHNQPKLRELIESHKTHARALAQGLGIAITYTQLNTPERIFRDFAAFRREIWPDLLNGARTALGGLLMEDPRVARELGNLPAPLNTLFMEARLGLTTLPLGPGWERRFIETCEHYTTLWLGLEGPVQTVQYAVGSQTRN